MVVSGLILALFSLLWTIYVLTGMFSRKQAKKTQLNPITHRGTVDKVDEAELESSG